jgi:hypothetical protein
MWKHECEMLQFLRDQPAVSPFIPTFLHSQQETLEIYMKPIGLVLPRTRVPLRPEFITSLIDYATGLASLGLADWDLRDANIMLVSNTAIRGARRGNC